MNNKEIWKVIQEAPNYEISSEGRVRNTERFRKRLAVLLKGNFKTDDSGNYISDPNGNVLEQAIQASLKKPKRVAIETNDGKQFDYIFELSTGKKVNNLYQRKQIMARVLVAKYFPELLHIKKQGEGHQILFHVDGNRENRHPSNIGRKKQEFPNHPEKWNDEIKAIINDFLVQYQGNVTKVLGIIKLEDNDANWQAVRRLKQKLIDAGKLPKPVDKILSEAVLQQIKQSLEQCINQGGTQERIAEKYGITASQLSKLKAKRFPDNILPIGSKRISPETKKEIQLLLTTTNQTYKQIADATGVSVSTVFKVCQEQGSVSNRSPGRRPIPDEVKIAVLQDAKNGLTQSAIAGEYGLSQGAVSGIINSKK